MNDLVHPKERTFYRIAFVFSMIVYALLVLGLFSMLGMAGRLGAIMGPMIAGYLIIFLCIWAAFGFMQGLFVARIRINAVKLGERQFGDVLGLVTSMSNEMGLAKVPDLYLLEAGGMLNAFATKFMSRNYVVIFADVFALAYAQGEDALRFVIAHELGHIHRKHLRGRWKILPGFIIPFLAGAYLRACEYTCDRYGKVFGKPSGNQGLLVLAAGTSLYGRLNEEELAKQADSEGGFFVWLAEILATHPSLVKRIKHFREFKR